MSESRPTWEAEVRRLLGAGQVREAVDAMLGTHGAAYYGYIAALVRDEAVAADAFQVFSIRLWQSLPAFRGEASLQTWAYRIARNAAYRTLDDPQRRRGQRLGTAQQDALAADWTRNATAEWQRTGAKERLWSAIEAFPPADRELLLLRLGRRMSWKEVAAVLHEGVTDEAELTRLAATARKRFERAKARLASLLDG